MIPPISGLQGDSILKRFDRRRPIVGELCDDRIHFTNRANLLFGFGRSQSNRYKGRSGLGTLNRSDARGVRIAFRQRALAVWEAVYLL